MQYLLLASHPPILQDWTEVTYSGQYYNSDFKCSNTLGIWLWMLVTSYSVNRWENAGNRRWATLLLPFSPVHSAKVTTLIHTFKGRRLCQLQKSTKTFSFFHFCTKCKKNGNFSKLIIKVYWFFSFKRERCFVAPPQPRKYKPAKTKNLLSCLGIVCLSDCIQVEVLFCKSCVLNGRTI